PSSILTWRSGFTLPRSRHRADVDSILCDPQLRRNQMRRRDLLPALAASVALAQPGDPAKRKGPLKQGVTRGVFARDMSLEDCCRAAARLGIQGFVLIGPADWPTL